MRIACSTDCRIGDEKPIFIRVQYCTDVAKGPRGACKLALKEFAGCAIRTPHVIWRRSEFLRLRLRHIMTS